MKVTRTHFLMLILLLLLGGYLFVPDLHNSYLIEVKQKTVPPLAGNNEINSVKITDGNGVHFAEITYFYRGEPVNAFVTVEAQKSDAKAQQLVYMASASKLAERGLHTLKLEIGRPNLSPNIFSTNQIVVTLGTKNEQNIQNKSDTVRHIEAYPIEWLDTYSDYQNRIYSKKSIDELYKEAVSLIDKGTSESLDSAKKNLDKIILRNPDYVDAYPEYARVVMKNNWGPEGLHQAEQYLENGLKIQSNHANSHVLLGYVYSHQKRFSEAEAEFIKAEKIGTNNLWLWTNWGEQAYMQNNINKAIEKYMKAVSSPLQFDTYDRARLYAYQYLIQIFESQSDIKNMDALYKKRATEYKNIPCFHADYATFKIDKEGEYLSSIDEAKKSIDSGCTTSQARDILGVANYLAWSKTKGDEKQKYLSQAQVFLPESPHLFYLLSRSNKTSETIKDLIGKSSKIDLKDNNKFNALAYALLENDIPSARRLINYGANIKELVGKEDYPVALLPVLYQKKDGTLLMIEKGVDFTKLKFQGLSGLDYAKQLRNQKIIDIIQIRAKEKI